MTGPRMPPPGSFTELYGPQCGSCGRAVTGDDGRQLVVAQTLLAPQLRARLRTGGWRVEDGDARLGRHDPLMGDKLTCPDCAAGHAAIQQAAERRHAAALARPVVKEVDLSARLGPGWTLRQRAGDADTQTWLVACDGEVRGMVRRYRRADDTWSKGWEAMTARPGGWTRLSATREGAWSERSSFLWRSRDLAAWGIATLPAHNAPRPAWATRPRP